MGVPLRSTKTTFSRSCTDLTRPMPRTTNSMPFSSITLPPTFRFESLIAFMTSLKGHPGVARDGQRLLGAREDFVAIEQRFAAGGVDLHRQMMHFLANGRLVV